MYTNIYATDAESIVLKEFVRHVVSYFKKKPPSNNVAQSPGVGSSDCMRSVYFHIELILMIIMRPTASAPVGLPTIPVYDTNGMSIR